jgi:hypothetical protein
MNRRSTPQSIIHDAAFPVRVKVLVPEGGFGVQFSHYIYAWLDSEVGRANYAQHPARMFGARALAYHFRDVELARRFLEAFPACRWRTRRPRPPTPLPRCRTAGTAGRMNLAAAALFHGPLGCGG